MTPAPDDPMIGRAIGRYKVLERVDSGGEGTVYRARDGVLKRDVALKLLPPRTLAKLGEAQHLRREALALSRLNHRAIVVIHDFVSTPELDCIVMEFVAGDPLDRILRRGALAEPEALRLGKQLAEGLAAAHAAGVIHRDLKPANLRITNDGWLRILDFGLASRIHAISSVGSKPAQASRTVVGTPSYIAPEVLCLEPATPASDLYAVGVILYEMATGVHPMRDLDARGVAYATLKVDPPAPRSRNPAISAEFETLIMRCLEKSPERRISSAQELARAFEGLMARSHHSSRALSPAVRRFLPSRRWIAIGGAALVLAAAAWALFRVRVPPLPPIRSLVVLPIANLSGDAGQNYVSLGMTDALISRLAEHPELRVISRTSSMHYDNTTKTIPVIMRELRVEGVVQGSMLISGENVHFSMQLIDGREDRQIWSKDYKGDRHDLLDIRNRVAKSIAREIGLRLTRRSPEHQPEPGAVQLYLKGRFHWSRRNADGDRQAIACFSGAIARDSLYAEAYSGLADAWATAGTLGIAPPLEAYPRAKTAALRALELDSTLSAGYVSLANVRQNFEWDWDGAAAGFRRAIELNDNNAMAHHWYSNLLSYRGELDRATAEIRHAQDLDPRSLPILVGAGACLYFARRYEEAIRVYQEAAALDSASGLPYRAMAGCYYQLGRKAETAEAIRRWLENQYPRDVSARASREYQRGGLRGMARVLMDVLERQRAAGVAGPATHLAELSILAGDREAAIRWLEVAFREHDTELNRLKVDPHFDPLRGDPRFQSLLNRVGLGPVPPPARS